MADDLVTEMAVAPGVDVYLPIWHMIESGGVPALLFLLVVGLFTGQLSSRRQADQVLRMQAERYTENDAKWKERWQEEKARGDRLEQLLFQQTILANRVGAIAERVAAAVVPVP